MNTNHKSSNEIAWCLVGLDDPCVVSSQGSSADLSEGTSGPNGEEGDIYFILLAFNVFWGGCIPWYLKS